ncbi:MAG TPA: DUF547 domain-containing protein [Sedimentisphaerales bacterium]|nr:DUF547 domain-containing protein [Sedimentisphaerales bacterium]
MAKRLVVLITSLTVLVFIAGCTPVESEPVEPSKTETFKTEPATPEPNETEPVGFELVEVTPAPSGPNQIEPDKVEPVYIEPDEIVPEKACPERSQRVESLEPEPNDVELAGVEPEQPGIGPYDIVPAESEPNDVEPAGVEPEQPGVGPDDIVPAEPEPNEVEPANVEPNNVEPNEPKLRPTVSFHDKCAEVLKNFVDDEGMVDYSTLRRKRLDLKALLQEFDNIDPNEYRTWPKEDKIAFWLNAYNIQMLNIITENYPIESSRFLRLFPGWGPKSILHIKGIWRNYKFLVMDEEFTLAEIDKRFFRKEFDDPRIFFAISRASLSSPPLRNEPYYGYKLNEQLDDQARRFLSSPLAFRTDKEKGRVYLSSLFQSSSYGREFISKFAIDKKFKDQEPTTRAVLNFITNYVSDDKVSFLEVGKYSVKFMKYDWTINDGS